LQKMTQAAIAGLPHPTRGVSILLPSYVRFLASHPGALAFGFGLTFFSAVGQTFFIALFNSEIRGVYDLTSGEFGTIYAVATLTGAMLMIRAGRQIDIWPLPWFAASVVAGLALAAGLMAVLPPGQVWVLFIAIVLLRLCGQGLMFHTAVTAAVRTFHAYRGQALSIVSLGFAAGEALLPVTIVAVVAVIGWRLTWGAAALTLVLFVLPMAVWLAHRSYPPHAPAASGGDALPSSDRSRHQVLRDPAFYLLLPAMVAPAFVNTGVFFHQVPISEAKNWTLIVFASAFTTYASATLVVMLVGGRLVDRYSAKAVLRFALAPIFSACSCSPPAMPRGSPMATWPWRAPRRGCTTRLQRGVGGALRAHPSRRHPRHDPRLHDGLERHCAIPHGLDARLRLRRLDHHAGDGPYVLFAIVLIQPALAVPRPTGRTG
jgi:MFS family permease